MRNAGFSNKTKFGTGLDGGGVGSSAVLKAAHVWGCYGCYARV
jgi:hypothetical protein